MAAVVVLLITFGSLVAMGLPILTALFALGVGLSLITLGTHVFDTADFAPQLALMIGLGVGIDYALFILTRFRNGLDEGLEKRQAAIAAVDTAGRAVLFAGITVIIALMGMFLLGLSFLYGVAMSAAVAVLMTMIAALTLLPAFLTIAGAWVDRLRIPGLGSRKPSTAENTRWFRWSREIQRRPLASALLSGGLLIALCIPTLSLRLGSNDAGTDPAGTTTRQAYDLLADGFGPGFNGPFSIVAALPGRAKTQPSPSSEGARDRSGRRRDDPGDRQQGRQHRRLPGLPDDVSAEREDDRPPQSASATIWSRRSSGGPAPRSTSAASQRSSRTSATRSPTSCRSSSASSCCSRRCC